MDELKAELGRFYIKEIKDHLVALNNEGFQNHTINVLKYMSLGVFDKMYQLDLQNEYFSEPNRNLLTDILEVSKMVGFKFYNFAIRRKTVHISRFFNK